eukprot:GEMP01021653.1.p1 GENE.GEMP01021653.1~~GEMP01021653.1.p1  ORF type:complete len:111 (-),score=12.43 GEMP01021653.1:1174-1506(-)
MFLLWGPFRFHNPPETPNFGSLIFFTFFSCSNPSTIDFLTGMLQKSTVHLVAPQKSSYEPRFFSTCFCRQEQIKMSNQNTPPRAHLCIHKRGETKYRTNKKSNMHGMVLS